MPASAMFKISIIDYQNNKLVKFKWHRVVIKFSLHRVTKIKTN